MSTFWVRVNAPDEISKWTVSRVVTDAMIDEFMVDPMTHVETPDDPLYLKEQR